jgi:hypothetical protein
LEVKDPSKIVSPERFDVALQVFNKGNSTIQEGDLILLTTIVFLVAPGDPSKIDVQKVMSEYSWGRDVLVDDVKIAPAPFLEPHKEGRVEFESFDLSKTNKVLSDKDNIDRVWAIKVIVHVLNRKMVEILQREAVITVVARDAISLLGTCSTGQENSTDRELMRPSGSGPYPSPI